MPNKKKQNAFCCFMKHLQAQFAKEGRHITLANMPVHANPMWAKLTPKEREPFERQARNAKEAESVSRLASDGTSLQQLLDDEDERERMRNDVIHGISELIRVVPDTLEKFKDVIPNKSFFILTFNILCCTDDNDYIPLEIGAAEYSIAAGIRKTYHKFIFPGKIPTGYTGESKRHSESTHKIYIYGHEQCERNYFTIMDEIKDFLNPRYDAERTLPPVFCLKENIPQTLGSLLWLAQRSRYSHIADCFRVWNLSQLLLNIRDKLGGENQLPSIAIADDMLQKNTFDYTSGTRCDYHDELDSAHCALGYSKRVCYLMSDALCANFGVEVTENHLPVISQNEKPYEIYNPPNNDLSMDNKYLPEDFGRSSRSSRQYSSVSSVADTLENTSLSDHEASDGSVLSRPASRVLSESMPGRQPQTQSVAAQLMTSQFRRSGATAPGTGIGRGLVKKPK